MSAPARDLPLLVFEAAGCLMAVSAAEVSHLDAGTPSDASPATDVRVPVVDLGAYFTGRGCGGPWLHWTRGGRSAWLRVCSVTDVVPIALAGLTPMPRLLRAQRRTCAFLAAGVRAGDVFLLLDPGRLTP